MCPGLFPLRILGAVSAGFGLAAEALLNSAERRKKSLSHTSQIHKNRIRPSARVCVQAQSPIFTKCEICPEKRLIIGAKCSILYYTVLGGEPAVPCTHNPLQWG